MKCIRIFRNYNTYNGVTLITILVILMVASAWNSPINGAGYIDQGQSPETSASPQENLVSDKPEANLPYLFAVFFVTWSAFFVYIFVISRRQRDMQREIDDLEEAIYKMKNK